MTTLADLTLAQLAAAYGAIAGIAVTPKTFNQKSKAVSRLETLLAERGLTTADALRAIGLDDPAPATDAPVPEPAAETLAIEPDADGGEPEPLTADGEDDLPDSGEDPGVADAHPTSLDARFEEAVSAFEATLETAPVPADAAAILAGAPVQTACRDWLADYLTRTAGLDADTAGLAARRAVAAMTLPAPAAPRAPRSGSKQDLLVELLRRPEGATLAQMAGATGWQAHAVRGALAGALKKRLGLTITSTKEAGGERVYRAG